MLPLLLTVLLTRWFPLLMQVALVLLCTCTLTAGAAAPACGETHGLFGASATVTGDAASVYLSGLASVSGLAVRPYAAGYCRAGTTGGPRRCRRGVPTPR